jgi:glycerophosphoryl diester phosphodiesterase
MRSQGTEGACPEIAPPFVVAHRAGNQLDRLREAERLGVALVEADVRLFRGRPEIRHLKTVGPLPLYWDRWSIASPFRRPLVLGELLAATRPETELMLDLKGRDTRLAAIVRTELEPYVPERRFTVCARSWELLEAFVDLPVRRFASVGSRRQLRALLKRYAERGVDGVSIHERLLDARVIADLRVIAGLVLTWPVNAPARAHELVGLGVDGLISDQAGLIAPLAAART